MNTRTLASLVHSNLALSALILASWLVISSQLQGQLLPAETVILQEDPTPPFGPPGGDARFGYAMASADFNGDGIDDLAAGQNDGDGRVYVFDGSVDGPIFAQALSQFGSRGFGRALASCDLNSDGFDDLIVGAPQATVDGQTFAGALFVYLGGPGGLNPVQSTNELLISGSATAFNEFGDTLATGDFDGDQECDVAVQSSGYDVARGGFGSGDGLITVLFGVGNGQLDDSSPLFLDHPSLGLDPAGGGPLGASLASAPSIEPARGLGSDRLYIGTPGRNASGHDALGVIFEISFSGQTFGSLRTISPQGLLVGATSYSFSYFGHALAVGEFLGQEHLITSAPGFDDGEGGKGVVLLLPLSNLLDTTGWTVVLQSAMPGVTPNTSIDFGEVLAVGDFDQDGFDDLAIGVPGDYQAGSRGSGPPRDQGSIHLHYASATEVTARSELLLEPALGNPAEISRFGDALVAADLFGRGADGLVVSAPTRDGPELRGASPHENNGVVYAIPARDASRTAEMVVRTGEPFGGDPRTVIELSDAAVNEAGDPGFRGTFDDGETFVGLDGAIVFEDSSLPDALLRVGVNDGFVRSGSSAFGFLDHVMARGFSGPEDVLVTEAGILVRETDLLPPVGSADRVGRMRSMQKTSDGRIYFRARDGSEDRILRTGPGSTLPLERFLQEGDPYDGTSISNIDQFAVSSDQQHYAFTGYLTEGNGVHVLGIDGARLEEGTEFLGDPQVIFYGQPAIDEAGEFAFGAQVSGGHFRIYRGVSEGGTLTVHDGFDPDAAEVQGVPSAVSLRDGVALHHWSNLLNRGSGGPPPGDTLLESCGRNVAKSKVVLRSGDKLRIDGSTVADTEVVYVYPTAGPPGIEATEQGLVYLHVGLRRGPDEFDAIIGVPLQLGLLCAGFETGDVSEWSASTP